MIAFDEHQFHTDVEDLLVLPELHSSRERVHHFDLTEYEHLLSVARHAHRFSRVVRADARICARAGLLHDLGAHWFNTVAPCALARRLEEHPGVHHAIRAHTLLPVLPRTREAWVVVAADFMTSAQECRFVFGRARTRAQARLRPQFQRPARLFQPLATATITHRRRLAPRARLGASVRLALAAYRLLAS